MSGFPSLQPAMTVLVTIDAPIGVGKLRFPRHRHEHRSKFFPSGTNTLFPLLTNTPPNKPMTDITIKSEPGFTPEIDAKLHGTANDYIHNDPDSKHMRLNAHGQVKDKSGAMLYMNYTGVVTITPELGAILSGQKDAKSTDFGDSFIEMRFETGDEKLKELEVGMFVGAGRFVTEQDKPVKVEYKLSKVGKGK